MTASTESVEMPADGTEPPAGQVVWFRENIRLWRSEDGHWEASWTHGGWAVHHDGEFVGQHLNREKAFELATVGYQLIYEYRVR